MASILKVDTIQDQSGNNIINESADTITIGASGDTITIPSGATLSSTDPLVFPAGTASLPAITTTGDTNTGIFFPAGDTIAFTTGGAESLRMIPARNIQFRSLQGGSGASSTAYLLDTTYQNALIFVAGQENSPVNQSFYMGIAVRSASTYTLTQIAKPAHGNGFGTVNVAMNGNYLNISFAAGARIYAVNVMYFMG